MMVARTVSEKYDMYALRWPLMDGLPGLVHLVQQRKAWVAGIPPSLLITVPTVTRASIATLN